MRTVSEKCMDHITNGPYQSLEKDSSTKIKAKSLQQLKDLKDNEFIDNETHYHLKPLNSPAISDDEIKPPFGITSLYMNIPIVGSITSCSI